MLYKGIALFTPAGDLIYSVDADKQVSWHLDLCVALQEILHLREPPSFLIPAYTATVDRWQEPYSGKVRTFAEIYPLVYRYRPILNSIFDSQDLVWQKSSWQEEYCNPVVIDSYRQQFPQLWENHHLLVRFQPKKTMEDYSQRELAKNERPGASSPRSDRSYVLRLFVAGNNQLTEKSLGSIYQLLEQELAHPYSLKIIDIAKHPEQAETYHVSATHTLMRILPKPVRRIVGNLEDKNRVLQILECI
jgi:circadian clock protein KaiB